MENIRPWCISRQLWWGHRMPVWYRTQPPEEIYVGTEPPKGEGWERDPDVLDTWFSSALWPFADARLARAARLSSRAFYPTDALVTGRDIIFLWVARMIMMGLEFTGQIPFEDVYVHSIIQAPDGRRMSKSLGTGIDPMDLIEGGQRPPVFAEGNKPAGEFPAYGADAVRWGLLAMSSAQDVRFSEDKVAQGQQLTNKLWNASRLILLGVGPEARARRCCRRRVEDRWILSRLQRAKDEIDARIERYDFSHAALRPVRLRLRRAVRLVPGAGQAAAARRRAARLPGDAPARARPRRSPSPTRSSRSSPRRSTATSRAPRGCWPPGCRTAAGRDRRRRRGARGPADRGRPGAARVARLGRRSRRAATLTARLVADGYEQTDEQLGPAGAAVAGRRRRRRRGAAASVAMPGGTVEILGGDDVDLEAAARRLAAKRGPSSRRRSSAAERKLANQGFVAKAPPEVVAGRARQARAAARGAGGAVSAADRPR